jgi:hydrogenase-1 operon protein HyaE
MNRHPLLDRLAATTGAHDVTPDDIERFEAQAGDAVLFFGGDPVRFPEMLDVAVVLPELHGHFGGRFRVGIVPRAVEDALARRYAVQRWPSLVFLRDGGYLGTVSGMKDWDDYLRDVHHTLAATPTRRPAPTIAIQPAGGAACH